MNNKYPLSYKRDRWHGFPTLSWRLGATGLNLLTNDALDPHALIPEFKACAVQVFPAREDELPNPDAVVQRGRY